MSLYRLAPSPYTQAEWDTAIEKLTEEIVSRARPLALFVFGSSLKTERNAESDIDLAVVWKSEQDKQQSSKAILSSWPIVEIPVDILFFHLSEFEQSVKSGGIGDVILRTGKPVYGGLC